MSCVKNALVSIHQVTNCEHKNQNSHTAITNLATLFDNASYLVILIYESLRNRCVTAFKGHIL